MLEVDAYVADMTADLRARLAELERERDALVNEQWAGRWKIDQRSTVDGQALARVSRDGERWYWIAGTAFVCNPNGIANTREAAMAAADAALLAAGWFLVGGPARAPGDGEG